MRLDYTILCIDDDIESLDDPKKHLKKFNDTVGIHTKYKDILVKPGARENDPEEYKTRIKGMIADAFGANTFDLIMIDLHLGPNDDPMGFKGHEFIKFIREHQTMYRPIVFYSGGDPEGEANAVSQLERAIRDHNLVGKCIFLSSRGELLKSDLVGICQEMHEEEHKLNSTRGLLMDRTSEVDAIVLDIVTASNIWNALGDEEQGKVFKKVSKKLKQSVKRGCVGLKRIEDIANGNFSDLKEWFTETKPENLVYQADSFLRNFVLRELLREQPANSGQGDILSAYFKSPKDGVCISKIRNDYAHQTEEKLNGEHNDGRCKFIRDELRVHTKNVIEIKNN
ncbi:MAG: hypothetical protein GQ535_07350 [Rhodobacteraceae bacterium]|nr:hypothetical protein [Paracoccaceae bacterium]